MKKKNLNRNIINRTAKTAIRTNGAITKRKVKPNKKKIILVTMINNGKRKINPIIHNISLIDQTLFYFFTLFFFTSLCYHREEYTYP